MERFKAPSHYPYHQYNRYSVETKPQNENSDLQSKTLHPSLTTSAVYIGDQYKPSAQGSPMYAPDVSRSDIVYYVPERTHLPQTSRQDKNVAGQENDLAEISAQFDSYATVDYIQPLYCNGNVIEE